jgi:hypothetical protein
MNEEEMRAYTLERGWKFVRVPVLPLGGYWKDSTGNCFYVREQVQEKSALPNKKERGK